MSKMMVNGIFNLIENPKTPNLKLTQKKKAVKKTILDISR